MDAIMLRKQADDLRSSARSRRVEGERKAEHATSYEKDGDDVHARQEQDQANTLSEEAQRLEQQAKGLEDQAIAQEGEAQALEDQKAQLEQDYKQQMAELDKQISDLRGGRVSFL